ETCKARGIAVCRLAGGNAETVAEHVFLQVLALYRRLPMMDRRIRTGLFVKEEARGIHREIRGKQVGIVGFGYVGKALAPRLNAFGAKVVYYDPFRPSPEQERQFNVSFMELDDLIRASDIITLHLPYQASTRNIMSAERIAMMKPDAILVNSARGGLVDEAALADALREHRVWGAAIDCWEREANGAHPIHELENTILTPHIAGTTIDNWGYVMQRVVSNVQTFLKGEPLPKDDVVYLPDSYGT
ncbi:MAG: lactate dehydrogenase, partial [Chloroflexi bacterium]|nr:lactate dehydrogenase [Chloroflexota bacterium]